METDAAEKWTGEVKRGENISLFVLSFSKSLQADLVINSFLPYLFETNISILFRIQHTFFLVRRINNLSAR